MTATVFGKKYLVEAVIPSGGTTSSVVDLSNFTLCAIDFPAMTGTSVTFEGSTELNGTYKPIADSADANKSVTVSGTPKIRCVNPQEFAGLRFIRAVSGSNEGAERTLIFMGNEC